MQDPFFEHMPRFFSLSFHELLAAKHPTAWVEFEKAQITEQQLFDKFFHDGRDFDGPALVQHMVGGPGRILYQAPARSVPSHMLGCPRSHPPVRFNHPLPTIRAPSHHYSHLSRTKTPNPTQIDHYSYVDGMQQLLARLEGAGYSIHAMSNYPEWWRHIEAKLRLSTYLHWTFISCEGPMQVRPAGL